MILKRYGMRMVLTLISVFRECNVRGVRVLQAIKACTEHTKAPDKRTKQRTPTSEGLSTPHNDVDTVDVITSTGSCT